MTLYSMWCVLHVIQYMSRMTALKRQEVAKKILSVVNMFTTPIILVHLTGSHVMLLIHNVFSYDHYSHA